MYYCRNKKKLRSGPPDHTHLQDDDDDDENDSIPSTTAAPKEVSMATTAGVGSESGGDEGAVTAGSSGRKRSKAENKRKPTKVSYLFCTILCL